MVCPVCAWLELGLFLGLLIKRPCEERFLGQQQTLKGAAGSLIKVPAVLQSMEDTRSRWERAFAESLDHDTWGQASAGGAGKWA